MKLVIELNEQEIEAARNGEGVAQDITEALMEAGLRPEEDFEILYSGPWDIVGVEITARHSEVVAALEEAGILSA